MARRFLTRLKLLGQMLGFDPVRTVKTLAALPRYLRDGRELRRQMRHGDGSFPFGRSHPCLDDAEDPGGSASGPYFHQDLLVARRIHALRPAVHIDIGSRIDGFVAHVAAFRAIVVLDIRPQPTQVANITFRQADLMAPLPAELAGSCDSLSCLHALEHFGLGRYGDPLRYDGHLLGLANLARLLRPGGRLYLSVPIGPQRIHFNAHRVFSVRHLLALLHADFAVDRFSYVDDAGALHEDVQLSEDGVATDFGCTYGCGICEAVRR